MDNMEIENLLRGWGLSQYTEIFEMNKITLNTLSMLDNDLTKELIAPVGDRARFLSNLANWKRVTGTDDEPSTSKPIEYEFVDLLNPSHRKVKSISEFIQSDLSEKSHSLLNEDENEHSDEDTRINVMDQSTNDIEETHDTNQRAVTDLPLKSLLMQSNEGKGLLNLYLEDGKLSNNGRRKLCNIIIQDLIKNDASKTIPSTILMERAQEIKNVFKKESISTYFIPYINDTKIKVKRCAKGKLYDCLQNKRRDLRHSKVIQKRNSSSSSVTDPSTSTDNSQEAETDDSIDCSEDILWLQNCTEPWHTVKDKWQKTVKYRMNEIKDTTKSPIDIHTYMTKYPVLKTPRGHELMIEDFNHIYPSAFNKLHENFPLIKKKLFKYALVKSHLMEVKNILEQLQMLEKDDEHYEEAESVLALMLVPLLLGNPAHRSKKQVWRPSKAEVRDGFITHVTRPTEIQETMEKRREKYAKYGLTFQPTMVIVGPNYRNIQKYYVVVNETFFETHSIIETVDTCFKIYHTLHCQYPAESILVWNFIQSGMYQIRTKWDKTYSTVSAFLTDLEINPI